MGEQTQTVSNENAQYFSHYHVGEEYCTSNLAAMMYDPRCLRCKKIKHVVALRRKGLAGGSPAEAESANALALKLVTQYRLTRGDVLDREYAVKAIENRVEVVRRATRARKKARGIFLNEFGDEEVAV